jgi:hypothetical protein
VGYRLALAAAGLAQGNVMPTRETTLAHPVRDPVPYDEQPEGHGNPDILS